jgi:hypothetical protein
MLALLVIASLFVIAVSIRARVSASNAKTTAVILSNTSPMSSIAQHASLIKSILFPNHAFDNWRDVMIKEFNDPRTGWAMGTYGGIAEWMWDPRIDANAKFILQRNSGLTVTSDRGALQIKFDIDEVKLICYEDVSSKGWAWNHGIAACLPESKSSMGNRSVLTKLGTDENALRSDAKDHVLFDMGLGAPHVDFCVRTNDPYLIDILTRAEGTNIFENKEAGMAIVHKSPNRIAITAMGRTEVYSAIPPPGGKSPEGPHTHLLPSLIKTGRKHDPKAPIPEGFNACVMLYPSAANKTVLGERKEFSVKHFHDFQTVLSTFGDENVSYAKKKFVDLVLDDGYDPASFTMPKLADRTYMRVALRQMNEIVKALGLSASVGPRVLEWIKITEPSVSIKQIENDDTSAAHN